MDVVFSFFLPRWFWQKEIFVREYEEKGYAVFSGKVGLYPLNTLRAIKISTEKDFKLAEALLKAGINKLKRSND